MADQTFALEATVVDGFSAPLKKLRDQLKDMKAPSSLTDMHKNFDTLRERVQAASSAVGRDFNVAMSGLGVTSIGAVASIAAVTAAVKRFSENTIEMRQFSAATGIASETLRAFNKAAPQFGVSKDGVQSSMRSFAERFEAQFKRGLGLADLYAADEGELANRIRNSKGPGEALKFAMERATAEAERGDPQRGKRILDAVGASGLHGFTLLGKKALDEIYGTKLSPITDDDFKKAQAFEKAVGQINDAFDKVSKTVAVGLTGPITTIMNDVNTWAENGGLKAMTEAFKNVGVFAEKAASGLGKVKQFVDDVANSPIGKILGAIGNDGGEDAAVFRFLKGLIGKTSYGGGAGGLDGTDATARSVHIGVLAAMREFAGITAPPGSDATLQRASYGGAGGFAGGRGGGRFNGLGMGGGGAAGGGGTSAIGPGGSAGAASRASMMAHAIDQLRKEGVPEANLRAAAAHLVGQADMESGLRPGIPHDNGTGYGIYGARLRRRSDMLGWLKANGYEANSAEGQMRYMAREAMRGNSERKFPVTRNILMNATEESLARDSWAITREFEAPARINNRSGAVMQAYRAMADAAKKVRADGLLSRIAQGGGQPAGWYDRATEGGQLLRAGRQSGVIGQTSPSGGASMSIELKGFPKGTKTSADGGGLFRDIDVNVGRSFSSSGEDI